MRNHRPVLLSTFKGRGLTALVFNALLAAGITASGHDCYANNLLYSELIGMSIWALIDGGRFLLMPTGWPTLPAMAALVLIAVLLGYLGGSATGDWMSGLPPLHGVSRYPQATTGFLLLSLVAGSFMVYWFMNRELLARAHLAQEEAQRQASEARLKLLETQLEPHMLFNTLANLRVLISMDPAQAITMLDHMNNYLRATLSGSRVAAHPLEAEFARLADYLELMAVRMGPRLVFTLDLPEALRPLPVPPLLLQPLVENAIRHGLEPQVAGGCISVRARCVDQGANTRVRLEVADTGVGLPPELHVSADEHTTTSTPHSGFGLTQVRERLSTTYGPSAQLSVQAGADGGTLVVIEFPAPTPPSTPNHAPHRPHCRR